MRTKKTSWQQRAIIALKRNRITSVFLFLLMTAVIGIFSFALFTITSLTSLETSMLRRMPAISTVLMTNEVNWDFEKWQIATRDRPTLDDILAISELPAVASFDARIDIHLYSSDVKNPRITLDETRVPDSLLDPPFPRDSASWLDILISTNEQLSFIEVEMESFSFHGILQPEMIDVESGLIFIREGRVFTQEEIDDAHLVAIVSSEFARENGLSVGSVFEMENNVLDAPQLLNTPQIVNEGYSFHHLWHLGEFIYAHELLTFEIIGIFEPNFEFPYENTTHPDALDGDIIMTVREYGELHRRIYIPITVAQNAMSFLAENEASLLEEIRNIIAEHPDLQDYVDRPWLETFFYLSDPRDLLSFSEEATELLPDFWEIGDLTQVNQNLVDTLTHLFSIFRSFFITAVVALFVILALVLYLLIYERKKEMTIYLSLGEKKSNLVKQLLFELLMIITVSLLIGIGVGYYTTEIVSNHLLIETLESHSQAFEDVTPAGTPMSLLLLNPGVLSIEEISELYAVSIDIMTLFKIVGLSVLVILSAVTLSLISVVKASPNKVLQSF